MHHFKACCGSCLCVLGQAQLCLFYAWASVGTQGLLYLRCFCTHGGNMSSFTCVTPSPSVIQFPSSSFPPLPHQLISFYPSLPLADEKKQIQSQSFVNFLEQKVQNKENVGFCGFCSFRVGKKSFQSLKSRAWTSLMTIKSKCLFSFPRQNGFAR